MTAPVYDGVGARLRKEREKRELDLYAVADQLKIRPAYLHALEYGQYDQMPGRVYIIGFLRTYAEFLQIDGDSAISQYKMEASGWRPKREFFLPEQVREDSRPLRTLVWVALALAAGVYGYWYAMKYEAITEVRVVAAPSEAFIAQAFQKNTVAGEENPIRFARREVYYSRFPGRESECLEMTLAPEITTSALRILQACKLNVDDYYRLVREGLRTSTAQPAHNANGSTESSAPGEASPANTEQQPEE